MTTDAFLAEVGKSAYGWPDSLTFTYRKTRELLAAGVPGALVECGVGNGVHPAAMWRACQDQQTWRPIRLFDSFQGLPHAGPNDHEFQAAGYGDGTGRLDPIGVSACSLPNVQANLARWGCTGDPFEFYKGWLQDTLPPVAEAWGRALRNGEADGIAFLRIDVDLYDATKACLDCLYDLVTPGGVIVVDDMNLDGCRMAVDEHLLERAWALPEPITETGDVWWTKP